VSEVEVRVVGDEAATDVLTVIHAAFGGRPPLDPPTDALSETLDSVGRELAEYGGLLATIDGRPVGSLIFEGAGRALALRRFGVLPSAQGSGVAGGLVEAAVARARELALDGLRVVARTELPGTIRFWEHHGFVACGRDGVRLHLLRLFPHSATLTTREDTQAFAAALAPRLRAGDLLILTGDLGAGKTTFTQGLGRALGVRGDITSPTFVIARMHPSERGGSPLVHADAYRLGSIDELDDLDLDTSLDDAVTVVEWGEGLAEGLADDRLEISIRRAIGSDLSEDHDPREIVVQPIGLRWLGAL